jgi:Heterokaryon incompatibility protein (HET)
MQPYEALSYVWGPAEPSRLIECTNGTKLAIGPHLFDAMKGLELLTEPRTFWIDQIYTHSKSTIGIHGSPATP